MSSLILGNLFGQMGCVTRQERKEMRILKIEQESQLKLLSYLAYRVS